MAVFQHSGDLQFAHEQHTSDGVRNLAVPVPATYSGGGACDCNRPQTGRVYKYLLCK